MSFSVEVIKANRKLSDRTGGQQDILRVAPYARKMIGQSLTVHSQYETKLYRIAARNSFKRAYASLRCFSVH